MLNNPSVYNRAAGGLTISQLITDFGRTHNLVLSAESTARAQMESSRATELDITLTVDQAFYQALTAQAVLKVAQETLTERQATADQVGALTQAKIRSDLDQSFADVQVAQSQLLLLDAQGNAQAAMDTLNDVLGSEQDQQYTLVDETNGNPPAAPSDPEALVQGRIQRAPRPRGDERQLYRRSPVQHGGTRSLVAHALCNGRGGRRAGSRRPDSVFLVRRRRSQLEHPGLQRLSL